MAKRKDIKKQHIIQLLIGVVAIVLVNVMGSFVFTRLDLTADNRYTLSPATEKMLKSQDDVVFIRVYLEGDLPPGFIRLRNATRELLDEFRAYSDQIEYEFIDPFEDADAKKTNEIVKQLYEKGLDPTNVHGKEKTGKSEKLIIPGAIIYYKGKEYPINLLKRQMGVPSEVQLNNSIETLEYEFADALRKMQMTQKPRIAFIEGHGELSEAEVADVSTALQEFYEVKRVVIAGQLGSLRGFDAIIVADPDTAFSEKDKFIIDQFIMHGGKAIWFVEPIIAEMDSLLNVQFTVSLPSKLNLEDQLFKYGVRLNTDILMDGQSAMIALPMNNKIVPRPWPYSPVVFSDNSHPVVKNLDAVQFDFVSSIDTVGAEKVTKIPLLKTSKYSRVVKTPTRLSLRTAFDPPPKEMFDKPPQTVAVLLEGEFPSNFKNRIPPQIAQDSLIDFREESEFTRMIVVPDGDVIRNHVARDGKPFPLEYDRWTRQPTRVGNKDFFLNSVNYLFDDEGLFTVRAREIKLRLLDKNVVSESKTYWQVINTLVPVVLILFFGLVLSFLRKRKYAG